MGLVSSETKHMRIALPRRKLTSAKAIYDTAWKLTLSHQWCEPFKILDPEKTPFSLEIYLSAGSVFLAFTASAERIAGISSMVFGIYPDAIVYEGDEYFSDLEGKYHASVSDLTYTRSRIFPAKTYRKITADPMAPHLSTLSQFPLNYRALFQLTTRSHYSMNDTFLLREIIIHIYKLLRVFRPRYWLRKGLSEHEDEILQFKGGTSLMWNQMKLGIVIEDPEGDLSEKQARRDLDHAVKRIVGSIGILNDLDGNQYTVSRTRYGSDAIQSLFERKVSRLSPYSFQACMNEMSSLWHLPNNGGGWALDTVMARRLPPPEGLPDPRRSPNEISLLGTTNFRDQHLPIGIWREDRRRHLLITGRSGVGKSRLLSSLVQQDIASGVGCGVLVPSQEIFDEILDAVPDDRVEDVVIIDPSDIDYPPSLNPLSLTDESTRVQVAIGMMELFRERFEKYWSKDLEHLFVFVLLTLLATKYTTVLAIKRFLTDGFYRKEVTEGITDRNVRSFWEDEYEQWSSEQIEKGVVPVVRMVDDFLRNEMLYNCLAQPVNAFDFREIIDSGKILLVHVPVRDLEEGNARLFEGMIVNRIFQAALSRADTPQEERVDFNLYVDNFEQLATESFEEILSESRKYRLNLTLSSQDLMLLPSAVRSTLFSNIANLVSFVATNEDAEVLEAELAPLVTARDLIGLTSGDFYAKIAIQTSSAQVFSGCLTPYRLSPSGNGEACRRHSRSTYCLEREKAAEVIKNWTELT